MKKYMKVFVFAVAVMLLMASCTDVFYSGIAGTVYDADNRSTGISGVQVYGYTSEAERDAAVKGYREGEINSTYKNADGYFQDKSCLYRAATNSQGSWTISKIVWNTKNSAWGKDYDHIPVYLIYFSEEIGLQQSQSPIEIVSSASNANAVSAYFEKIMKSHSVSINFKDGTSGNNISDNVTLTYSYNNGYVKKSNQVTVTGGTLNLTVTALKTMDGSTLPNPVLTLSDIAIVNKGWSIDSTTKEITIDKDSINQDYELTKLKTAFKVTVNLKEVVNGNELNTNVSDTLKCTYSYYSEKDTDPTKLKKNTADVSIDNGVFSINLSVNLTDVQALNETPQLILSNFSDPSDCWDEASLNALNSNAGIVVPLTAARTDIVVNQGVNREKYDLGNGVSGTVSIMSSKLGAETSPGSGVYYLSSLDGLNVELSLDVGANYKYQVLTNAGDYSNKDAKRFSTTFSGLASDIKIDVAATNILKVRCNGKVVDLDLQQFFAQKNAVSISLD